MHDLLPSHLSSSQEAVGAGSSSISILVLYLSSTPSLNIGSSSWGSTVLFIFLRRLEPTPVHNFLTFFQGISCGRQCFSTFSLLQ